MPPPRAVDPTGAPLLPKLRGQFAEFLQQSSLMRLRILSSTACVGLRYGRALPSLAAFLGSVGPPLFVGGARLARPGLPWAAPRGSPRRTFHCPARLPSCVPASSKRTARGAGMLTSFPSPTPFGLGLGAG